MRLIDADVLLQELGKVCVPTTSEFFTVAQCVRKVKDAPTIDIKTEVAREIFAEIEKVATINLHTGEIKISAHEYAELKNKCTEENIK